MTPSGSRGSTKARMDPGRCPAPCSGVLLPPPPARQPGDALRSVRPDDSQRGLPAKSSVSRACHTPRSTASQRGSHRGRTPGAVPRPQASAVTASPGTSCPLLRDIPPARARLPERLAARLCRDALQPGVAATLPPSSVTFSGGSLELPHPPRDTPTLRICDTQRLPASRLPSAPPAVGKGCRAVPPSWPRVPGTEPGSINAPPGLTAAGPTVSPSRQTRVPAGRTDSASANRTRASGLRPLPHSIPTRSREAPLHCRPEARPVPREGPCAPVPTAHGRVRQAFLPTTSHPLARIPAQPPLPHGWGAVSIDPMSLTPCYIPFLTHKKNS